MFVVYLKASKRLTIEGGRVTMVASDVESTSDPDWSLEVGRRRLHADMPTMTEQMGCRSSFQPFVVACVNMCADPSRPHSQGT